MCRLLVVLVCLAGAAAATAEGQEPMPAETLAAIKAATVYVKVPGGGGLATGSGWLMKVDGDEGYLVTNHHVVAGARTPPGAGAPSVMVVFASGTKGERAVTAEVLASERQPDLAVIKVRGVKDLPRPIAFDRPPELVETLQVLVFGFPYTGLDRDRNPTITVTRGAVSSVRADDVVQLDTNLNPGNSGGPVVDTKGRLVGVAFARPRGTGDDPGAITGIGLAIPAAAVTHMVEGYVADCALRPGKAKDGAADVEAEVRLVDPLGRIPSVELHYARAESLPEGKAVGDLPGANAVTLKASHQKASGRFHIAAQDPGVALYYAQPSWDRGSGGRAVGDSVAFHVNFPGSAPQADRLLAFEGRAAGPSQCLAIAPDGKTLAVGTDRSRVQLWDMARGWQSTTLTGPEGYEVRSVAFSPDGKLLATACYTDRFRQRPQRIVVWDLTNRTERRRIEDRDRQCVPVTFSPNGQWLASGSGGDRHEVKIWDVATGARREGFGDSKPGDVLTMTAAVAFSPDGRTLAAGSNDGTLRVWDVASSRPALTLGNHGSVEGLAWAPDGKVLASAHGGGAVVLWDTASGKEARTLKAHRAKADAVAFNSSGTLLASAGYESVKLWHAASGRELATLSTPDRRRFRAVAISPDDRFLVGVTEGGGASVIVWGLNPALENAAASGNR